MSRSRSYGLIWEDQRKKDLTCVKDGEEKAGLGCELVQEREKVRGEVSFCAINIGICVQRGRHGLNSRRHPLFSKLRRLSR